MYFNIGKTSQDDKPQVQSELKRMREDSSEDESIPDKRIRSKDGKKNPSNKTENRSKVGTVKVHVHSCLLIHSACSLYCTQVTKFDLTLAEETKRTHP